MPIPVCPECGREAFERGYHLDVAAPMVPMTLTALKRFLSDHKTEYRARFRYVHGYEF